MSDSGDTEADRVKKIMEMQRNKSLERLRQIEAIHPLKQAFNKNYYNPTTQ